MTLTFVRMANEMHAAAWCPVLIASLLLIEVWNHVRVSQRRDSATTPPEPPIQATLIGRWPPVPQGEVRGAGESSQATSTSPESVWNLTPWVSINSDPERD